MNANSKLKSVEVSAVKILADGTHVDLGVIAFTDCRSVWRRIIDRLRGIK